MDHSGFETALHSDLSFAALVLRQSQDPLAFVCQVVWQYFFSLPPDARTVFATTITQVLTDAVKQQLPTPPIIPSFTFPFGEKLDQGQTLQRESELRDPFDLSPTSSEWSTDSLRTPPPENIAFRTIPCRNWIKFKGQCRLGDKCKFIHDPAFIADGIDVEFPSSPSPHCWSYLQGTCQKGRQCKYYHPPAAHLPTYQRHTPCREWGNCSDSTCPFQHASTKQPAPVTFNLDCPSPTSSNGFDIAPYLPDFQSSIKDRSGNASATRHSFAGFNPFSTGLSPQRERDFGPLSPLDTIQEEWGSMPGGSGARRMSMVPTQTLSRIDFSGFKFGNLESLRDTPITRPRGKSFDISIMSPPKRGSL